MINGIKLSALIILAFMITACSGGGGGGGGSSSQEEPKVSGEPAATTTVERVSLTGLAIKGLAVGAKVELFAFDEDSGEFSATALATTETNNEGRYSFTLETDPANVVKVRLSYLDGAQLQCDNVNTGDDDNACGTGIALGDFYDMPADFALETISNFDTSLINASGNRIANLSALTTLAAAVLEDDSSDDTAAEKVLKSQAQVRALFDLPSDTDLIGDEPDDLNSETDEGQEVYGAINAAFQAVAINDDVGVDEIITQYRTALQNNSGQLVIKSASSATASLAKIIDAADAFDLVDSDLTDIQQTITDATDEDLTDLTPPVVSLGSNQSVQPGAAVTITASTVQGTPTTYTWDTNAPVTLTQGATSQSFNAPLTEGNYVIALIVEDADGLSSKSSISLQVKNDNIVSDIDGNYFMDVIDLRFEYEYAANATNILTSLGDGGSFTLATGDQGSLLYPVTNYSRTEWEFETLLLGNNQVVGSAKQTITEKEEFTVAVQANGLATVDLVPDVDLNTAEGYASIDQPFTLRFYPLGNGLLVGSAMPDAIEYTLNPDDSINYNSTNYVSRHALNVVLAKKSTLSSVTSKSYRGFELMFGVASNGYIVTSLYDRYFDFNASSQLSTGSNWEVNFDGSYNGSFTMLTTDTSANSPDTLPVSLSNGRFVLDNTPETNEGSHNSFYFAPDQSALLMRGLWWRNDGSGSNTSFTAAPSADDERNVYFSMAVKTPASPVSLANTTFSVMQQGYFYDASKTTFAARATYGEAQFGSDSLTLTLNGKSTAFSSASKLVKSDVNRSLSLSSLASLTTDAEGCLDLVTSNASEGMRLCTDGETLLMRRYGTDSGVQGISIFIGTKVSP